MFTDAEINKLTLDTNFQKLHRQLNTFNIFKATGITDWEIKHTQFLGYLLDPHESHDLKEDFLFQFIQATSLNQENPIPVATLNLGQARVFKEKTISQANGRRIDLLLEIPTFSDPNKYHILAIENKIQAAQGNLQLQGYSEDIENSRTENVTGTTFLYLTVSGEDPNCEPWQGITYSDVVLTTIKGLLEDNRERTSDYLIYILNDYLEFINDLQDQNNEPRFERTVKCIPDELIEIAKNLADCPHSEIVTASVAKTRYKKALDYLKLYENDLRTKLLRKYNELTQDSAFPFRREHSIRSYLRFSFLTENAREKMREICHHPTKPWLEFPNHLAIELVITETDNDNQRALQCRPILTLGPTGTSFLPYRSKFVKSLRRICGLNEDNRIAPHFTRITPHSFPKAVIVNSTDEGGQWLEETVKKIKSENKELIEKINQAIVDFKINDEGAEDTPFQGDEEGLLRSRRIP